MRTRVAVLRGRSTAIGRGGPIGSNAGGGGCRWQGGAAPSPPAPPAVCMTPPLDLTRPIEARRRDGAPPAAPPLPYGLGRDYRAVLHTRAAAGRAAAGLLAARRSAPGAVFPHRPSRRPPG